MSSSSGTVVRFAIPGIVAFTTLGALACSGDKELGEKKSAPLTLADGNVLDVDAPVVDDAWITSDGGAAQDTGSADTSDFCPQQQASTLNAFLPGDQYIQIDRDPSGPDAGPLFGANANLVVGEDPATEPPSGSFLVPGADAGIPDATYIDWTSSTITSSLESHRLNDVFAGKDPTAFPGSDSCVGLANNPPKDEIVTAGIANNNEFVYLNVLRNSSSGDMGYMWLFTKDRPPCGPQGGPQGCSNFLRYHIQEGDVLIFGHFRSGGTQLLQVYTAKTGADTTINAEQAINCGYLLNPADPASNLWIPAPAGTAAVAVNTDLTDENGWLAGLLPGLTEQKRTAAFGTVTGADGRAFDAYTFAEAAVKTSTFGTNGVCGQTFWSSVISKSSGTSCDGSDVKDLIGPRQVNFGSISANVQAKPNCDGTVDLQATVTGSAGTHSCKWYDGTTLMFESPTCDAVVGVTPPTGAGTHSITVQVSETGGAGCTATSPAISVTTATAPTATACSLTPYCTATAVDNLGYTVTGAGGLGTLSYKWTVTNSESTAGLPQPTDALGTMSVSPVGPSISYSATVDVTDSRGCKATCNAGSATPLRTLSVTLNNPLPTDRMCVSPYASLADAVTFAATNVSGGTGSYSYTWDVKNCDGPTGSATCTDIVSPDADCFSNPTAAQCVIDPAVDTTGAGSCVYKKIAVTVDDTGSGSSLCPAVTSVTRTYHKTTTIDVE